MTQRLQRRTTVAGLVGALVVASAPLAALAAPGNGKGGPPFDPPGPPPGVVDDALEVTVLHINDHHSHLQPDSGFSAKLSDDLPEVSFDVGGFPQVVEKMQMLERRERNVVKVHAGDAITGTLFYSLFKGQADADLMNEICFDMMTLGNHEFDDGDDALADGFLTWLSSDPRCDTDILSANVVPAPGAPLEQFVEPYTIEEIDGEQVAFVGLTIAQKTQVSSSPRDDTVFEDEIETAQATVDELTEIGVENIVLVTHYGYENDLDLAEAVTGVDAVIGGDSHTLLGDFDVFGLNSAGEYPTMTKNLDGEPVCVAQAWQYSHVVGELSLRFEDGVLESCDGTPHLVITEPEGGFTKEVEINGDTEDVPLSGRERSRFIREVRQIPNASVVRPDQKAQRILDAYAVQVDELAQRVIGQATEDLCLERIPGQGRSGLCPVDAVSDSGAVLNVNGGFIQQIVTDAFASRAFRADFALQNAGGVRIDIPAGDISIADAYELLPFANTLVELELTGQEVADVLEDAVDNFLDDGGSSGSYPYGSGIRWDVDLSQPSGSRFSNIEVKDKTTGEWGSLDVTADYVVVTNSFIASGRDGYDAFGVAFNEGRVVDTFIDYAQGFIDWVEEDVTGVVSVPAPGDFSTQSFLP